MNSTGGQFLHIAPLILKVYLSVSYLYLSKKLNTLSIACRVCAEQMSLYQEVTIISVSSEISYKSLLRKKNTEYEQKSLHSSPQTAEEIKII